MREQIQVTRANPALAVFMVDMSGSMSEEVMFEGKMQPKNGVLSQITNLTLTEMIYKCRRGNEHNDYFNIAVLGYDGTGVTSLLSKYSSCGKDYCTINELVNACAPMVVYRSWKNDCYIEKSSKKFVTINAFCNTPMYEAFEMAYTIGKRWIGERGSNSVPPIFINITDGGATDASDSELLDISKKIKSLNTLGGDALLFNVHISSAIKEDEEIKFPTSPDKIATIKYAYQLYQMSSELPEWVGRKICAIMGQEWQSGMKLRAVSYNTSVSQLFDFLQIGSLTIL